MRIVAKPRLLVIIRQRQLSNDPSLRELLENWELLAAQYLIIGAPGLGGEWGLRPNVTKSVYALLDGAAARRAYWGHVWFGTAPTSPWRVLATAESVWPWGGKVLRRTMRVLRAPFVELVAVPIALRAARLGNAHEVREARTPDIRSGEP